MLAQQVLYQLSHTPPPASVVNFIQQKFPFSYYSFHHQYFHCFLISYTNRHIHTKMPLPAGKVGLKLDIPYSHLLTFLIVMPPELALHACFIFKFPLHVNILYYLTTLSNSFTFHWGIFLCLRISRAYIPIFLHLYISSKFLIYARHCNFTGMGTMVFFFVFL